VGLSLEDEKFFLAEEDILIFGVFEKSLEESLTLFALRKN